MLRVMYYYTWISKNQDTHVRFRRHLKSPLHFLIDINNPISTLDVLYTKMILWSSPTSWGWSQTSIADNANARHADVFLATLLTLRGT